MLHDAGSTVMRAQDRAREVKQHGCHPLLQAERQTAAGEARATGQSQLGLQRMQHQVAVNSGFESWNDLLNADEADLQLAMLMDREPQLNTNGFGPGAYAGTLQERRDRAATWRAELRASAAHVDQVRLWLLTNIESRKTLNEDADSYRLKHFAENALSHYVSNGQVIAAAMIGGYASHRSGWGSPNAIFGMSSRSLTRLRQQQI